MSSYSDYMIATGNGTIDLSPNSGGFRIPFIPGGDIIQAITGFIFSIIDTFLDTTFYIIWFLGFFVNLGLYWMGHLSLLMMIIEIFIIGLSVLMGGINPIRIISSFITLHFKIIYMFFMLTYYLIMLIYQGIIALTTWIP